MIIAGLFIFPAVYFHGIFVVERSEIPMYIGTLFIFMSTTSL